MQKETFLIKAPLRRREKELFPALNNRGVGEDLGKPFEEGHAITVVKVAVVEGYGNGQDLSYLYLIASLFVGYYHRALLNGIDTER